MKGEKVPFQKHQGDLGKRAHQKNDISMNTVLYLKS